MSGSKAALSLIELLEFAGYIDTSSPGSIEDEVGGVRSVLFVESENFFSPLPTPRCSYV